MKTHFFKRGIAGLLSLVMCLSAFIGLGTTTAFAAGEQAEVYSGIGADKLRELSDREDCEFVLWNGTKRLIKRKKLDEFLERAYSI